MCVCVYIYIYIYIYIYTHIVFSTWRIPDQESNTDKCMSHFFWCNTGVTMWPLDRMSL